MNIKIKKHNFMVKYLLLLLLLKIKSEDMEKNTIVHKIIRLVGKDMAWTLVDKI